MATSEVQLTERHEAISERVFERQLHEVAAAMAGGRPATARRAPNPGQGVATRAQRVRRARRQRRVGRPSTGSESPSGRGGCRSARTTAGASRDHESRRAAAVRLPPLQLGPVVWAWVSPVAKSSRTIVRRGSPRGSIAARTLRNARNAYQHACASPAAGLRTPREQSVARSAVGLASGSISPLQ